jgi:flagellin
MSIVKHERVPQDKGTSSRKGSGPNPKSEPKGAKGMSLQILNNISSIAAENQLTITSNNLQSTLFQLSSGSRINTGADDAAGLAIANGLQANVTALTQSARNANDGVGALQVADGSLAQVTTLLNRAVTLATEASTSTVSNSQRVALDAEFTQIKNEINRVGSSTNYNGSQVFTANPLSVFLSDSGTSSTITATTGTLSTAGLGLAGTATAILGAVGNATAGDTVTVGGQTYTFAAAAGAANTVAIGGSAAATLSNLAAAINGGAGAGVAYGTGTGANGSATAVFNATDNSIVLTSTVSGVAGNSVASTTTGTGAIAFSTGATFTGGAANGDLLNAADAQGALLTINTAIASVAATRGTIGAAVNRLQSASNVISNQVQNLTAAQNGITAADIPSAVASLTKYSILEQTGISALSQANQQQQLVLKLLQ